MTPGNRDMLCVVSSPRLPNDPQPAAGYPGSVAARQPGSRPGVLSVVLKRLCSPPRHAQAPTVGGLAFDDIGLYIELLFHHPPNHKHHVIYCIAISLERIDMEERRREGSERGVSSK